MKWMRIQFTKLEEVRFISHLDLMRALMRAFRRSRVPIAFSQGFNPHHQVSMGPPLAVGVTSTGEYMDVQLAEEITVDDFFAMLKPQMPRGLDLVRGEFIPDNAPSLMAQIDQAVYLVRMKTHLEKAGIEQVLREFYSQRNIIITRQRKGKEVDLKPLIRELKLLYAGDEPVLQMRVQTGSKGNARPEEVMAALSQYGGIEMIPLTNIHRQGLYVEQDGGLLTPFEAARI